jgi:hypothetical protein
MPSSVTAPEGQLSRRDKFRAYMQAFNPTAPAREVIDRGLVFEGLHQALYRNLAGRADLEPGSQQLLVGGVGCGKTTELILARRWLIDQGHVLVLYTDVSAETDLSNLNSGSLLACFGMSLGACVLSDLRSRTGGNANTKHLAEIYDTVTQYAYGKQQKRLVNPLEDSWSDEDEPWQPYYVTVRVPGKLNPPFPPRSRDIQEVRAPLEEFLAVAKQAHKDVVVIFDGLDRLLDATKFWSVVHQDLRLLRELKVSVLATAPLSVLFGAGVGQTISDYFDRVQHLSVIAADPDNTSLRSVIDKRRGSELLTMQEADAICYFSGGVLRDLISLARDAAEEAYVSDHDSITAADVEKVVRQLGTGYLRGLGPDAIQALLQLESYKSFSVNLPVSVELLLTRRVLEYSSTDFRIHPALLSVIPRQEPKRA